ncbi:rhodanese-like domain-containing protein [Geobacter sp. DSM 9736]|uniref:rhodanese-like domain-containing protein n=1 Tax=Geobacter sp. DSM 9736 TaxID=1277350 RepID=UPI000B5114C7|nr:rhodanese-like domain-containing protein [Geobacter sp. DSM 9736]SNB48028.1 Rhodanese-related sulfurtransferase [Geobacter sp. DSM 9736]
MNSSSIKKTVVEIALLLLVATLIGSIWNQKLLRQAWTGKLAAPAPAEAPTSAPAAAVPLPVGLMQVKDFFDRNEAVIVDARDRETFTNGRIRGALSLPLGEADTAIARLKEKVPPESLIIIYCNGYGCHDSMELGRKLIAAGYGSVFVFEGGYPEWRDAGYPVEGNAP